MSRSTRNTRIALVAFAVVAAVAAVAATYAGFGRTEIAPSDAPRTVEEKAAYEAGHGKAAAASAAPRTVEEMVAAQRRAEDAGLAGAAGKVAAASSAPRTIEAQAARVARGRYLVQTIGCGDCHTPKLMTPEGPVEDETRLLSGHPEDEVIAQGPGPTPGPDSPWVFTGSGGLTAWRGPWGTSFTANLTPDVNTGLGIWTEDMFVRALRTGKHMGQSRPILPPMPWMFYKNLSDEDLEAIYAYLRTIEPIHNRVPEPLPPYGTQVADAGL